MATIVDVAKKARVSVITVSRLLNNPKIVSKSTSKRIFQAMEDLNYQPSQIARSLVKKRTNTIGIIIPNVQNTFFNSWFRFIEEYASAHSFNLLLCNTDEDAEKELRYIKLLQSQRVDGIIIAPCSKNSVEYLNRSDLRFILFDRMFRETDADFVTTNHYQGAYEITEYLIKLGHKKIAVLKGKGVLYPDIERYLGYRDAMKNHNLEVNNNLVLNCEFDEMKAHKATRELLFNNTKKPTAIFSFNSLMTFGAIRTIQNMKLSIPDDISLVCYDEIPGYTIFHPQVTHVLQPIESLGKNVIVALIDKIKNSGHAQKTQIFLKPKLVIGKSCKRIRGNA